MKRLVIAATFVCMTMLPLSALAATTSKNTAKPPIKKLVKFTGYMTALNGKTFTFSTEKNGVYTVQTDAKTKVLGLNNKKVKLKTLSIPHILEVSGMVTNAKKKLIHATSVKEVGMKKGEGQIIGKVGVGPICTEQNGERKCSDQPFRALLTIKKQDGTEVKKVGSNDKGYFVASLPAGTYVVHPEKPDENSLYPTAEDQTVTVKKGTFALVQIDYNSGEINY